MKIPAEKPSQSRFRDFRQPARRSLQKLLKSEVSPMARLVWRRCTRRVHASADEALEPKRCHWRVIDDWKSRLT